jgi:hypothetical protein
MEQSTQKLRLLREVGATLVANNKAPAGASFVGTAIRHFAKVHGVENTSNLDNFIAELSTRLWKTGRLRINPTQQEVFAFLLRSAGLTDKPLIDRIIH